MPTDPVANTAPLRPRERVAEYPRPPRVEPARRHVRIIFAGLVVADTDAAMRVLETFHPPTYYLPPDAFRPGSLEGSGRHSFCEWKGEADYFHLHAGDRVARNAAWAYPDPTPGFVAMRDYVAVYAGAMDRCEVDGEVVTPQPGGFYGGWITSDLIGPFKGEPGTAGW